MISKYVLALVFVVTPIFELWGSEPYFLSDPGCREKHLKIISKSPWFAHTKRPTQQEVLNARREDQRHLQKVKEEFAKLELDLEIKGTVGLDGFRDPLTLIIGKILPLGGAEGRRYTDFLIRAYDTFFRLFEKKISQDNKRKLQEAMRFDKNELFKPYRETIAGELKAGCFEPSPLNLALRLAHEPKLSKFTVDTLLESASTKFKLQLWKTFRFTVAKLKKKQIKIPNLKESEKLFSRILPAEEKWRIKFRKGWDAYNNRKFLIALNILKPLANKGKPDAQVMLAQMYRFGNAVSKNDKTSFMWLKRAAEQGHARGQTGVGLAFENGLGVIQDYKSALTWYKRAADQGNVIAMSRIGYLFKEGLGATQSYGQAFKWTQQAADKSYAPALSQLAYMYYEGEGTPQNYSQAFKYAKLASEQGTQSAQRLLGILYLFGRGTKQSLVYAHVWLHLADPGRSSDLVQNLLRNIEKQMSQNQVLAARALKRLCLRVNFKGCSY